MLNDPACKNAKPREKPYKLSDEKGLYLEVMPNGSKYFRMKYRFDGKEKRLALGVYPETGLKQARDKRDDARKQLAQGIDPGAAKQAAKAARAGAAANSFEVIAREWHEKHKFKWTEGHAARIVGRLENDIFPWLGKRPVAEITASELLATLRRIEARGALDTAHRMHQVCTQVFRYAVATGRAERNPGQDITGALPPVRSRHLASITDEQGIGELMRNIEAYQGSLVTRCALMLSAYTFCRAGEIRHMEWTEVDFDKAEWRIPAAKMKMRAIHIVPLSPQALAVLEEIRPLTGHGRYVFPNARAPRGDRAMSENAVLVALRAMGYSKEQMTAHGFRSMASTRLNESHLWHRDAIERQLAHAERDEIRAAYNYAEHLPERRKMMTWWADYLDGLKAGATVLPFKRPA